MAWQAFSWSTLYGWGRFLPAAHWAPDPAGLRGRLSPRGSFSPHITSDNPAFQKTSFRFLKFLVLNSSFLTVSFLKSLHYIRSAQVFAEKFSDFCTIYRKKQDVPHRAAGHPVFSLPSYFFSSSRRLYISRLEQPLSFATCFMASFRSIPCSM